MRPGIIMWPLTGQQYIIIPARLSTTPASSIARANHTWPDTRRPPDRIIRPRNRSGRVEVWGGLPESRVRRREWLVRMHRSVLRRCRGVLLRGRLWG